MMSFDESLMFYDFDENTNMLSFMILICYLFSRKKV
jgi:hypothetical protein